MAKSFKDQKKYVTKEQFKAGVEIKEVVLKKRGMKTFESEEAFNLKGIKSFEDVKDLVIR